MTTNVYELARLIAGVDEQQWNDDLPEYVRVKHTQAAQRLIAAGFSAPPAVSAEATAATNERETLAGWPIEAVEDLTEHIWSVHGPGATESLFQWMTWEQCVEIAKSAAENLAATQRPDDREATLRAAVLDEAMNRILDNRDEDEDGSEVTQGMVNAAALISLMIVQTGVADVASSERDSLRVAMENLSATWDAVDLTLPGFANEPSSDSNYRAGVHKMAQIARDELRAALAAADGSATPAPEATTVTEWGVLYGDEVPENSIVIQHDGYPDDESMARIAASGHYDGDEVVSRQRTSYADHVTDWAPADGSPS